MKKIVNSKEILIIFLSIILILSMCKVSFADNTLEDMLASSNNTNTGSFDDLDDEEDFIEANATVRENTNANNTNTNTNNTTNALPISTTTNNTAANNTINRNVSNTNTLAKTGISDNGGLATLIVLISIISAVYSYKKINDYKKI